MSILITDGMCCVFHSTAVTDNQIHSHWRHNTTTLPLLRLLLLSGSGYGLSQMHIDVMTVGLEAVSFAVLPGNLFPPNSQFLRPPRMVDFPTSWSRMIKFTLTGLSAQVTLLPTSPTYYLVPSILLFCLFIIMSVFSVPRLGVSSCRL